MASSQRADPFATVNRQQVEDAGLAEVLTLLRRIDQSLSTIVAHALSPVSARPAKDADAELLAAILPILGEGLGTSGRAFTAADALGHLNLRGCNLPISAKSLGWTFKRCQGTAVAGFRVRRDSKQRGSTIWRVWRV